MAAPLTYVTSGGDCWDMISFRLFGSEYFSDQLIYTNPAYAMVWVFDAGALLTVPNITPKRNIPTPPWVQISA